MPNRDYYVYVITNAPFGTLYIGVTSDIAGRVYEHKTGSGGKFAKTYHLNRLVYVEHFDDPTSAIQREKTMKLWPRQWKLNASSNAIRIGVICLRH